MGQTKNEAIGRANVGQNHFNSAFWLWKLNIFYEILSSSSVKGTLIDCPNLNKSHWARDVVALIVDPLCSQFSVLGESIFLFVYKWELLSYLSTRIFTSTNSINSLNRADYLYKCHSMIQCWRYTLSMLQTRSSLSLIISLCYVKNSVDCSY